MEYDLKLFVGCSKLQFELLLCSHWGVQQLQILMESFHIKYLKLCNPDVNTLIDSDTLSCLKAFSITATCFIRRFVVTKSLFMFLFKLVCLFTRLAHCQ